MRGRHIGTSQPDWRPASSPGPRFIACLHRPGFKQVAWGSACACRREGRELPFIWPTIDHTPNQNAATSTAAATARTLPATSSRFWYLDTK
jgi:hypothetical protein